MTTREDCIPDDVYAALREEFEAPEDEPWACDALVAAMYITFSAHEADPELTQEVLGRHATELAGRLGYLAAIDHGAKTENLWTVVRTLLDALERGELLLPHVELTPASPEK